jgi:thiol-disulfide isomerase/thioredoxin
MCFAKNFFGEKNISKCAAILLVLIGLLEMQACGNTNPSATRNEPAPDMVLGECSWEDWQKGAKWDDYSASDYLPDSAAVQRLATLAANPEITFLVFGASWCGDSRDGIPKIYKVFRAAKIEPKRAMLYGVNRQKREQTGMAEKFQIKRVPTLIVLKGNKEIGRIVEVPMLSWEKDLEQVLSK